MTEAGTAMRTAMHTPLRSASASALLVLALLAGGCATVAPAGSDGKPAAGAGTINPVDPWEAWNRKVFAFNEVVDDNVLRPVAEGYRKVVPALVRTGINNVFGNIGDAWSAVNQLLQGKVHYGLDMGMRVLTNTLLGFGGILDPATEFGLVKRSEDFGQTLGKWGLGQGPYLVLPLLGPSTVRDGAAFLVDRQAAASTLAPTAGGSYSITALELVSTRANLLSATSFIGAIALDKYSFFRDAYLSRRLDAVYDGAPPLEDFGDEPPETTKSKPNTPSKPESK
jgi:phospholipid-binding lipoprotein MlaA